MAETEVLSPRLNGPPTRPRVPTASFTPQGGAAAGAAASPGAGEPDGGAAWPANDPRFRQFADALPFVLWVAPADGRRLLFASRAYETIFGRQRDALLRDPAAGQADLHPDDRAAVVDHLTRGGDEGVASGECRFRTAQGAWRWGRYQVFVIRDEAGNAVLRAGTFEDITDARRAQEALVAQRAALAQAANQASIGELAASVTHEITQPLCVIGNLTAACRLIVEANPQWGADELARCLAMLLTEIDRTRQIATRLRDFARRAASPRSLCNLNDILRAVLALLAEELRERQVVALDRLAPLNLPVRVDAIQMTQVVVNLVRNACDAVAQNEPPRRCLELRSECRGGRAWGSLADLGPVAGPQNYQQWFQAFFTTRPNGLGLGLNVCRTLVEDHGGHIGCEPNEPCGTRVTFSLPIAVTKGQS